MIKKIIFDLDNTLIPWKSEYVFALRNVLDKLKINYTEEELKTLDNAFTTYENFHTSWTKDQFLNYINKNCNLNLKPIFVELIIDEQAKCFEPYTESELDTIKYLYDKYELIVLTNWYTKTQRMRLENVGIAKYFSIISGGDEHELKPSLNAYKNFNPKECVMVGDNIKNDIEPPLELGMKAILITKKNLKKDLRYQRISKLEELKEIL